MRRFIQRQAVVSYLFLASICYYGPPKMGPVGLAFYGRTLFFWSIFLVFLMDIIMATVVRSV